TPYGLAAADGRLYVSTDRGTIYCFDGRPHAQPSVVRETAEEPKVDARYAAAAEEILRHTGVRDGHCLDLGAGTCDLAIALAQRTNLQIYALCSSAEEVQAARRKLQAAGLYGVRITVHLADPAKPPYGKYFADLVVSAGSLSGGPLQISADDIPA